MGWRPPPSDKITTVEASLNMDMLLGQLTLEIEVSISRSDFG